MKKSPYVTVVIFLLAILGTSLVIANKPSEGEGFNITITPKTLILSSPDTVVSVHSDIPYSIVDTLSLTLDGIEAVYTKSDSCGCLVVKFRKADVKDIVEPGEVELTLSGELKDCTPFEASDTITVKE